MTAIEGPSSSTPQILHVSQVESATLLKSINTDLQHAHPLTSPRADRQYGSLAPGDIMKPLSPLTRDDITSATHTHAPTPPVPPASPRELAGETTPSSGPTPSRSELRWGPLPAPLRHHPTLSTTTSTSHPKSFLSRNDDSHAARLQDYDVNRLTRELWDTRRQLTALRAREQVILDNLGRLGARPEGARVVSQDKLLRLETELRSERTRRVRAERALHDVERECRAPFVVPALFQAFMSISELSD